MIKQFNILILKYAVRVFHIIIGTRRCFYFLEELIAAMQNATQTFITYHCRPKRAALIRTSSQPMCRLPKLAIVIQGPIIEVDSFTLETVKLYKKHFPNAFLILSTWSDQKPSLATLFETLGIHVLLNAKPDYAGVSNINLQIVSSKAGVKKARELGAEYVLKTRTDQRMYALNIEEYLYNIIQLFPVNANGCKQDKRIVGMSMNTFKYRLYGLSDMLLYGHIDDMIMYWDVELDNRRFSNNEMQIAMVSPRSFVHWRVCEVYLATEFLMKIGRNLEWSLKDSWRVFADHFCVVDKELLDLYWCKYGFSEFRWKEYEKQINVFEEMSFKEWLNLYSNQTDYAAPEVILDIPLERQLI